MKMNFKMYHSSIDVLDLDRSLDFYKKALGLEVMREIETGTDARKIVYIGTPDNPDCMLELNWYADREKAYDLGENTVHQGFNVDNYDEALAYHRKMGCVREINECFGVYYITDPDGYIMEIVPTK